MTTRLSLHDAVKTFDGNPALDDVTLEVAAGELHAVIGPNGAGKSTLFASLAGEFRLDRGHVYFDGKDITRFSAPRRVRLGIGRAFQVASVFPSLTVAENVAAGVLSSRHRTAVFWSSRALRRSRGEVERLLESMRLVPLADRPARDLSQGDRKRLEIAVVLALQPSVLLLDEPTAGMSPEETEATTQLVRELWAEHGMTVLLTEHDMDVVFGLAQKVTVLHRGHILCSGDPEEVRGRADVAEVYLGGAA